MKIITWVDLQGRYRVTSPAYNERTRPPGESDDDFVARIIVRLKAHYSLPADHPFHLVEDADQRARLLECEGTYFRYAGMPDAEGRRDSVGGAWEMDVDGRPKVNISKARAVHMDRIRTYRNAKLVELDSSELAASAASDNAEVARISTLKQRLRDIPATFDLTAAGTPTELMALWPGELSDVVVR